MRIKLNKISIDCDIQYGKRKKISIHIDETGFITVKVPNNTKDEVITDILKKYEDWIIEKSADINRINEKISRMTYDEEGRFLYLGKEYYLYELIEIDGLTEEELKVRLKKFYFASIKGVIEERIKIYQEQLGVKPKSIEINESKTKWGSCDSEKKIIFNYKLAMAPIEAIDYVIVHELCHLLHMNHDRSFWRRVGSILPDYKERQEMLKKLRL